MLIPKPSDEHRWLLQLLGNWEFEHECSMGPDKPPMKTRGKQATRALGELWILSEIVGPLPDGGEAHSLITLGFDPIQGRFVGSFVSSCMTNLWPYIGSLDAAKRILTLDSQGPSFANDGNILKYQDIIEIIDCDHHTMTSRCQGQDGVWTQFMYGQYVRV